MKAVVGVDTVAFAEETLRLFSRLKFPSPDVELLNVVDATLPVLSYELVSGGAEGAAFVDARRQVGEAALQKAQGFAKEFGLDAISSQVYGPVTTTLMDHAADRNAELIGVRASLRGPLESVVYGSVSRALAIGAKQSVLVVKGGHWKEGPVRAVFATDHSVYCDRAIDHFLAMNPGGLESVCVVSAYQVDDEEALVLHTNLAKLGGQVEVWIEEKLQQKTNDVADKFRRHGINATAMVVNGHANDAIRHAMNEFGGELLILGAHGHGFVERLLIGSVSLNQVVGEPYSVFLVRA